MENYKIIRDPADVRTERWEHLKHRATSKWTLLCTALCLGVVWWIYNHISMNEPQFLGCQSDTGGHCRITGCGSWRGNTTCVGGRCLCPEGFCANAGRCLPEGTCVKDTGASCHWYHCGWARGPTECSDDGYLVGPRVITRL